MMPQAKITIVTLVHEMREKITRNRAVSALCVVVIFAVSLSYAIFWPGEYVASMVVVPIESTMTDATSQLLSTGFSLQSQFSLSGGPPPQMAAFLKVIDSPEVARYLAVDRGAVAIICGRVGLMRRVENILGFPPPQETYDWRVSTIRKWLDSHVTVDQDVALMAWTINVRDPDGQSARYILGQLQKDGEDILRRAAVGQYARQHDYVINLISQTNDAMAKQSLYTVLVSINRSLAVLRSGSNVATNVVSRPYVPEKTTYPSRLLIFFSALIALSLITFLVLAIRSYRALKYRYCNVDILQDTHASRPGYEMHASPHQS